MLESTASGPESPIPKELITPAAIIERTMQFFRGVDLNQIGNTETADGLITVSIEDKNFTWGPRKCHTAKVNGIAVAYFALLSPNAEPLPEPPADRIIAQYSLYGHDDKSGGNVKVIYEKQERRPEEITLTIPGGVIMSAHSMHLDFKKGPLERFNEEEQRVAAETLGIKI